MNFKRTHMIGLIIALFLIVGSAPSGAWRGHKGHGHHFRHGHQGFKHHRGHGHQFGFKHRSHGRGLHFGRGNHGFKSHFGRGHHRGFSLHFRSGHHRRYRYPYYGYRFRGYDRYPYGYRHRYRSYGAPGEYSSGTYGSSRYGSDESIDRPVPPAAVRPEASRDMETAVSPGWDLLKKARPDAARRVFGQQAQASPRKGTPKVGYALAAAELGRLDKGIWAMRRALRHDPDALHYITVDETLRGQLGHLARRYHALSPAPGKNADTDFMLAALYYLMDDYTAAHDAISRSLAAGDPAPSAQNLQRLIEAEIQDAGQPKEDGPAPEAGSS